METISESLAIAAGNSPVTGDFPAQRPVVRSFDVLFDLSLNKRLSKQSWGCSHLRHHRAHYDVTNDPSEKRAPGYCILYLEAVAYIFKIAWIPSLNGTK